MILIVDCGSTKVPEIVRCVTKSGYKSEIITIQNLPELNLELYTAAIISGAPILLTQKDVRPFLLLSDALFKHNMPILGICFGHQLMALHYGASVFMGSASRTDISINILSQSPIFKGMDNILVFNEDHCEYASLPLDFDLIAKSEACANEAMENHELQRYGVQFHPESSGDNGQLLIDNFLELTNNP